MLLPFDFAVITYEEAKLLRDFIRAKTDSPDRDKDYDQMRKDGVLEIYSKLDDFCKMAEHYEYNLQRLDPSDFVTRD